MFENDNEATNEIAGEMFTFIANEIESYRSKFGTMTPGILPVSGNTPFGLEEPEMLNSENGIMPHPCGRVYGIFYGTWKGCTGRDHCPDGTGIVIRLQCRIGENSVKDRKSAPDREDFHS